jgi:L-fuculose-phosphate aldolase
VSLQLQLIEACRQLALRGLTYGTSGNVSVRRDERTYFISPTGMSYDSLEAEDIPLMDFDGRWFGRRRPSSEWRFHRHILAARPEINAIVHTHSPKATALACIGRAIPAFHYMVAVAGGTDIRCAPYHTFGSQELAEAALAALEGRLACLLANHGVIALGAGIDRALSLAGEVEDLADKYCTVLSITGAGGGASGGVRILDAQSMQRVLEKFRTYGQQEAVESGLEFGGDSFPRSALE